MSDTFSGLNCDQISPQVLLICSPRYFIKSYDLDRVNEKYSALQKFR